jgi:hypothetical protein
MENVILWALGTGLITGIVGTAIVLSRRRPAGDNPGQQAPIPDAKAVGQLGDRIDLLEERLSATEYRLQAERESASRIPPR